MMVLEALTACVEIFFWPPYQPATKLHKNLRIEPGEKEEDKIKIGMVVVLLGIINRKHLLMLIDEFQGPQLIGRKEVVEVREKVADEHGGCTLHGDFQIFFIFKKKNKWGPQKGMCRERAHCGPAVIRRCRDLMGCKMFKKSEPFLLLV